jgi:hypothetical protein
VKVTNLATIHFILALELAIASDKWLRYNPPFAFEYVINLEIEVAVVS